MKELREKNRSYTSKGPGVMPYRRTPAKPAGFKLYRKAMESRFGATWEEYVKADGEGVPT